MTREGWFRRYRRLPAFVRWWLIVAWPGLILSHLMVRLLSFRRLAPLLGANTAPVPWVPTLTAEQTVHARLISQTVQTASRHSPWPGNCFDQAIVARCLLGLYRIPYALFFGVARTPGARSMKAHAWVAAGRIRVVGGRGFGRFAVVNAFCSPGMLAPPDRNPCR